MHYKGEEITFRHLVRPYDRGVIHALEFDSILDQLTIRKEVSLFDLWQDQLKNNKIIGWYKSKIGLDTNHY